MCFMMLYTNESDIEKLSFANKRRNFSLAEWNKISEKCFLSHHWGLGIGHMTCGAGTCSCFCCMCHCQLSCPPTQRFEVFSQYQDNVQVLNCVLLHPVSSIMLLVFSSDFAIKVKQKQSAWLSEVCLLSIAKHVHTALNIFDISLLMMLWLTFSKLLKSNFTKIYP